MNEDVNATHKKYIQPFLELNGFEEVPEKYRIKPKDTKQFRNNKGAVVVVHESDHEVIMNDCSMFTRTQNITELIGTLLLTKAVTNIIFNEDEKEDDDDNWILVDTLPPKNTQVLGYFPNMSEAGEYVDTAHLNPNTNEVTSDASNITSRYFKPTHWRHKPKVPSHHVPKSVRRKRELEERLNNER